MAMEKDTTVRDEDKMIKVRIEKPDTGEIMEFEGDKVRVNWHNNAYNSSLDEDDTWHYLEIEEEEPK